MISFTKAHACGNDFLIIPEESVAGYDKEQLAVRLCDRNTGIGADGIEFFQWTGDTSGRITLYNADGSVAEISGNGTRCVAACMAQDLNSLVGDELSIETDAGVRVCTIDDIRDSNMAGRTLLITTNMDVPECEEKLIELADGTEIDGVFVNMGNPHFVIVLNREMPERTTIPQDIDLVEMARTTLDFTFNDREWDDVGSEICFHPDFPEQTNVEFVYRMNYPGQALSRVAIRIYERGVGPTTSSGTGTSAVAAAVMGFFQAESQLEVVSPGGIQTVDWAGEGEPLYLTGPATLIARGEAW